jgi:hypothetical protein
MSDTILSGRWTVYYLGENRRKAIKYTGSGTRDSMKDIYLALMDLYHTGTQMDDGTPMEADTPVEYRVGKFDAGDNDPMFIDPESMQYAYGGSLKTEGWKRVTTTNTGIVRFDYTVGAGTDFASGDLGKTVASSASGDSGTLLYFITDGSNGTCWVRPDDETATHDWDSTPSDITVSGGTGLNLTQDAASTTGEMNWANIYNDVGGVASLVTDTHLAIYQGVKSGDTAPDALILEYDIGQTVMEDYWADGTFDIMLLIADQSSNLDTQSTYIDEGFATVLARQYGKTYSYNIASLFPGGRVPIGMETGNDLNNNTGYRTMTMSGASGNWSVGDEIEGQTSGARGIITAINNPGATQEMEYYLIGKSTENGLIAFTNGETVDNNDDTGTGTLNTGPADDGPANYTGLSVTHANDNTFDVDQNDTNEYYSIVFDVNSYTFVQAYEWAKYTYRRGNTATTHADGIEAEQYIGSDYRVVYTGTVTGTVAEGDVVTGVTSGAKGTVVAHHTTGKIVILRNSRGTFQDAEQIQVDGSNYIPASGTTVETISPVKACPLGTFAGGVFFFAPGVVPDNRVGADANSYQTTDDLGNTEIAEPIQITVKAGNTRIKDWIAIHRLTGTGGSVKKDTYTVDSGGLTKGGNTVVINEAAIGVDEPGKTTGGVLVVRDVGTYAEHVYHYSSWTGQTFTLDQSVSGTATGGDTNTLQDSGGGLSSLRVGELVRDTTNDEWAYVVEVTSDTSVETTAKATSWNGAGYVANDLVQDYDSADKIYVPLLYVYETVGTDASPGSAEVTFRYDADFYALLKARHAADSSYNIKTFAIELAIVQADKTQDVIRTAETIMA